MAIYNGHNEDSSGNILLSIGNGMTATVETGSKASQAYTKGAYLFFNNRLCKATTAIAANATLAVGTNLSNTSVGQELTSHLRSSDGKEFYFDLKDGKYGYYPSASKVASEFVPFGGTTVFGSYAFSQANFTKTITCGFKPKGVLVLWDLTGWGFVHVAIYHETYTSTQWFDTGTNAATLRDLGAAGGDNTSLDISNTGFTYTGAVVYGQYPGTVYYFAVG